MKIYYDHERGDTLYEQVQWVCSPTSRSFEIFSLVSYDGMDEVEWELEIIRFFDGQSEINQKGSFPLLD